MDHESMLYLTPLEYTGTNMHLHAVARAMNNVAEQRTVMSNFCFLFCNMLLCYTYTSTLSPGLDLMLNDNTIKSS